MNIKSFWDREFAIPSFLPTWMIFQRLGGLLAYLFIKFRISPNVVTISGAVLGTYSCYCFVSNINTFFVSFKLALFFSFVYILDCTDGQIARATNRTSVFGKYLDLACDFYLNMIFPICCGYYYYMQTNDFILFYPFLLLIIFRNSLLFIFSVQRSNGKFFKNSNSINKKTIQIIYDTPIYYILISISRINFTLFFIVVNIYAIIYFCILTYKMIYND